VKERWRSEVMGACEARERRNASPSPPLGAGTASSAPNEPRCLPRSKLVDPRFSEPPVVAQATEHDRQRQCYPGRESEREYENRDAEYERVHPSVVVRSRLSTVPRTRDPNAVATMRDSCG